VAEEGDIAVTEEMAVTEEGEAVGEVATEVSSTMHQPAGPPMRPGKHMRRLEQDPADPLQPASIGIGRTRLVGNGSQAEYAKRNHY
jgi:hypothetical protein